MMEEYESSDGVATTEFKRLRNLIYIQREEIAKLKLPPVDLNEHDDEITSIEITNQAFATLADARINKLIDENNELKAQANALRESLSKNQEWVRCGIGGNCSGYPKDHKDYIAITDLLNKTPAQCLQSVKADAVDDVYDMIATDGANIEDAGELIGHTRVLISVGERANKLREGKS